MDFLLRYYCTLSFDIVTLLLNIYFHSRTFSHCQGRSRVDIFEHKHFSLVLMKNVRCVCPQHYTKDADGLCTRLIKPKLMEGTVAAQDEFSRSKDTLSSLGTHRSTDTRSKNIYYIYLFNQERHIMIKNLFMHVCTGHNSQKEKKTININCIKMYVIV